MSLKFSAYHRQSRARCVIAIRGALMPIRSEVAAYGRATSCPGLWDSGCDTKSSLLSTLRRLRPQLTFTRSELERHLEVILQTLRTSSLRQTP